MAIVGSQCAGLGSVADALRLTGAGSGRALDRDERPDPPLAVDAFESFGSFLKKEKTTLPACLVCPEFPLLSCFQASLPGNGRRGFDPRSDLIPIRRELRVVNRPPPFRVGFKSAPARRTAAERQGSFHSNNIRSPANR